MWGNPQAGVNRTEAAGYLVRLATIVKPKVNTIIDIGCGVSTNLEIIRGVLGAEECVGVDHSVEAIVKCRDKYPWGEWIPCDVERAVLSHAEGPLSFYPEGYFDFVYSSHLIEHVSDPYKLLDEQYRLTRENGMMAVVAPLGMYSKEHVRMLEVNDVVGMLRQYGMPIFVYTDARQSEVVAGVLK